jgi:hypothetical protein
LVRRRLPGPQYDQNLKAGNKPVMGTNAFLEPHHEDDEHLRQHRATEVGPFFSEGAAFAIGEASVEALLLKRAAHLVTTLEDRDPRVKRGVKLIIATEGSRACVTS